MENKYGCLRRPISNGAGFTIIELLLALAITGIVSAGLFSVFNTCMTSWNRFREREKLSLEGRVFLDKISYQIRNAATVYEIGEDYIYLWPYFPRLYLNYYFDESKNAIYEYAQLGYEITGPYSISGWDGYRKYPHGESTLVQSIKNVSDFKISTNNNTIVISLTLETENTSITYRTAVVHRASAYYTET